ncbi:hypothetical protein FDH48_gp59 [Arthrobacter phage Jawnski]|uniref:Helix-turn-helix DNA binding domain protein n=3 Tax=Jawnskivirus TaxID=3425003 RepID=A0A222Z2A8_9CAUD|nr:hypothetical protein FDH48_gp59 [Arthrobacter phage Jawnski]ALY09388.1 helix-turn-helix DNA binding domain protein [Arthrobacter phage Jawnski]ASR78160.1 helix-turn-helix DNA binding domain protein [Arthrobacter phage Franzy]QNJ59629.1 hypothetical protein SEA_KING2_59 [Arthrobacter phage King2]
MADDLKFLLSLGVSVDQCAQRVQRTAYVIDREMNKKDDDEDD